MVLDSGHPLAGIGLRMHLKLLDVRPATGPDQRPAALANRSSACRPAPADGPPEQLLSGWQRRPCSAGSR